MYKIISLLSIVIRQFLLPNPFAALPNGELYNWMASAILFPITFFIVGLFYESESAPELGSLLFLFFYLVHTGLIALCGVFHFNTIACIVIGVAYVALLIYAVIYKNRCS